MFRLPYRMARGLFVNGVVRPVARGLGAALLAGIGWRLGVDAYDYLKKEVKRRRAAARPAAADEELDEGVTP